MAAVLGHDGGIDLGANLVRQYIGASICESLCRLLLERRVVPGVQKHDLYFGVWIHL